jgi:hypothetical protein
MKKQTASRIPIRKIVIEDKSRGRTRIIYNPSRPHDAGPLTPLLANVPQLVTSIVPENQYRVGEFNKAGISISIDMEAEDFYIAAHVREKRVILGRAALERIWAHTYFHLAALDLLQAHGSGVQIDLTKIPEIQPARNLAIWALACEKSKKQTAWPEELPRPDRDDGSDDHIGKTNAYFYNAVCFIILHEIGHIQLQHLPSRFEDKEGDYRSEFDADAWAADFMLRDWQKAGRGEKDFIARCTGIALGLATLASVELYHHATKDDHPTIAERLLNFFRKHLPESDSTAAPVREFPMWAATAIIHGHFLNAGVEFPLLKSFDDFTTYLIEAHRAMNAHKNQ